ncbi:MAG: DUF6125 family protein [bacterium]
MSLQSVSKDEIRELLSKGWMTHDAMWFAHSVAALGIDKTNEVNRAAVRSMAHIELSRLKKLLGVQDIRSFGELQSFVTTASELIKPRFMKYRLRFEAPDVMRWEWEDGQCFAYQGIKSLGLLDRYRCGIFVRVEAWLDGLGIAFERTPAGDACSMRNGGRCNREFRVSFAT